MGLPVYDGKLCKQTADTIQKLKACKEIDFDVVSVTGVQSYRGRNVSAKAIADGGGGLAKQKMPYDYLLTMDSDMAFDVSNVKRLIALEKDIVGGAYGSRDGSHDKIVAGYWDKIPGSSPQNKWLNFYDFGLKEVDWCGTGSLLIKKEVLETMEYPYFTLELTIDENGCRELASEDFSFCMNAKKAGFKIFCDLDNRFAHLKH